MTGARTRHVFVGLLLALAGLLPAGAQAFAIPPVAWPRIAAYADTPEGFVPDGWRLEHVVRGNLDDDTRPDLLLLLRMDDPENVVAHEGLGPSPLDTNPRMLVAAFASADGDGGYRRAMVDHALIPRAESPVMDDYLDDPAASITIAGNRSFTIRLHSWASAGTWFTSSRSFTFRHQDGCFRLIGYDFRETHRASGETEEVSVNYLSGRAWRRDGSIQDDGERPKRWTRLPQRQIVCIGQVGDGFGFDPGLPPR
ncbi:hypothetical protein LDO26_04965 [Luteimonas sp. BDR2-5]|uniref:hypothetical protein n=1 Tax=Proluteimonas luteida TaxID=2878685 RepID=UPI001E292D18|nr:hypothetical protein [Luteimonas sp. BDR2-5]MCD9027562.1 hypothetical protein [Luteimonas sp. BDR2-5]